MAILGLGPQPRHGPTPPESNDGLKCFLAAVPFIVCLETYWKLLKLIINLSKLIRNLSKRIRNLSKLIENLLETY